jgi:hypothetical protein
LGDHCTYAHERRQRRPKAVEREEQREEGMREEEQAAYYQYYNQLYMAQQLNYNYDPQFIPELQPLHLEKEEPKQHSELSTPDMCESPETKTHLTTLSPSQQEFILKQPHHTPPH